MDYLLSPANLEARSWNTNMAPLRKIVIEGIIAMVKWPLKNFAPSGLDAWLLKELGWESA